MKHMRYGLILGLVLSAGVTFTSCKDKKNNETETTTTAPSTQTTPPPAPVEISGDEQLRTGVEDATKDYPGVTATVANGEITLTGDIERARLQNLMQSLNSLQPKKINNNLNIK